jgi:serine/threonine-protein kinase
MGCDVVIRDRVALPVPGLYGPEAVAVDTAGNVYITDPHNNQVVKLPPR